MSQSVNEEPSSGKKTKRDYRKGKPLTGVERQQQLIAKRKETHKELRIYLENELKAALEEMSKENGLTQTGMIEKLIVEAQKKKHVKD